jgi:hypothetical protein
MRRFYGAIVAASLIGTPAYALDQHISLASYCLGWTLEYLQREQTGGNGPPLAQMEQILKYQVESLKNYISAAEPSKQLSADDRQLGKAREEGMADNKRCHELVVKLTREADDSAPYLSENVRELREEQAKDHAKADPVCQRADRCDPLDEEKLPGFDKFRIPFP